MTALPVDAAMTRTAELPAATRIAAGQVAVQYTRPAIERQHRVLDVDVIDAIAEAADELDRVNALPVQVTRIEREAELRPAVQRVELISAE